MVKVFECVDSLDRDVSFERPKHGLDVIEDDGRLPYDKEGGVDASLRELWGMVTKVHNQLGHVAHAVDGILERVGDLEEAVCKG